MSKCEHCGTDLIYKCYRCGAPVCCPRCCADTEIQSYGMTDQDIKYLNTIVGNISPKEEMGRE